MSTQGWRIGTLSGVPVYLGRSWLLVAVVIMLVFGPTVDGVLGLGAASYVVALLFAVLLLLSVLAHEAAHALMGQRVGFTVTRIVADFWGGHTAHDAAGVTPARSAAVAVVGPLANGLLALLGWALMGALDPGILLLLAMAFTWANAFVALFNLVPGLPLDGGFLLEALVWQVTGNRHRATEIAGWAGRGVALLVLAWGLSPVLLDGERLSIARFAWVAIIALFLWQGAGSAIAAGRRGRRAAELLLGTVARPVGVVDPATPLASVAWGSAPLWVVQQGDALPEAVVHPASLAQVPHDQQAAVPVSAVAVRMAPGWAVRTGPEGRFEDVLEVMRTTGAGLIVLLDEHGRPWGAVLASDLDRAGAGRRRS